MNEILTLVTFLALLFYTGIEMKFQLQMLQQNSYRNDRYNRWLKGESFATVSRLTDLFLLLLLSTNFLPTFVQIVTITVVLAKSVKGLQTKYKKPLVFTKRATRLYIAALSLSLLVAGLAAGLTTLSNGSRALLAIAILAPYFMMTANIIMQPVEKRINRKYYDEAKQILSQMQDLTVIGITGSYGKTSTKHYLYRILCERYNVLMTPGSFNTPMGVIRTIREQMKPYHNIFICEMGAKQIGDIKEILLRVNERLTQMNHTEWITHIMDYKVKYPLTYPKTGLSGPYVIEEIYRETNGDAIIVTEVGQHQMWAAQYYKYKKPRTLLTSGGLGTMGYGLGAAIGAQIGCPEKQVINIAGDGCFRMNMNEIATAVRQKLPLIEVIINNHVLGMVRQWQDLFYEKRYSATVLDDGVDYVKLAEAMGAAGYRATNREEFNKALKKALASDTPVVIDCIINSDDKVWPMVAPGEAISSAFTGDDLKKKQEE